MGNTGAEAKIYHLRNGLRLIQQNVFKLNVSVGNVPLVAVVNTLHDLGPQKLGFQLRHLSIGFHLQVAVETASIRVLHNNEHLFVRLKRFIEFRNIRVVKFLHDLDFSLHGFPTARLDQLHLVVDLDCDLLVQELMQSEPHHSVSTLADPFADDVVVKVLNRAALRAELQVFCTGRSVLLVHLSFVKRVSLHVVMGLFLWLRIFLLRGWMV